MKKIMTIALMCAMTMVTTISCSSEKVNGYLGSKKLSGEIVTQDRSVKGFDKIVIDGCPTVYYVQGTKTSVVVKADKALIKNIKTTANGSTLSISYEDDTNISSFVFGGSIDMDDAMKIYVTSPDITSVTLNGSGDFKSEKKVDTDNMDITLKGSGDIDFKSLICDNLSTTLVGSGDIDIKQADALKADMQLVGSGDMDINLANTKTTNIVLKGSGDIKIGFDNCNAVSSQLMGSGDITLKGDVKSLNRDEIGSGDCNVNQLRIAKR